MRQMNHVRKTADDNPAVLNETEDPLLREWARDDNSELNNPAPSKQERSSITTSIEMKEAQVLELQLMIARERAIRAPIRMLPPEILGRIFVEADRAAHTDLIRISILTCCRKWLQIGLRTPSLWSLLRFSDGQYPYPQCDQVAEKTRHALGMAGKSMLDIYAGPMRHSHTGDRICDVIGLLSERGPQIRSIKSSDDMACEILIRALREHGDLPNVVGLEAHVYEPAFGDSIKDESLQLSGLQSLKLYGQAMQNILTVVCPLLVTLVLRMDSPESCLQPFWKFLANLPNLQSFTANFVPMTEGDRAEPPKGKELLLPNLTHLSMSTNTFAPRWWPKFPGNIILAASPKVSDLEIVMDADITPTAPSSPICHVTKLTVKAEGKSTRGKHPVAIRRKRIREWLDAFPALHHLHIVAAYQLEGKPCEFVNTLLESSAKRVQKPCLPSLVDLKISEAQINMSNLLEFSKKRSLASDGGVLKSDKPNSVARCLITVLNCPGVAEVTSETADGIFAANTRNLFCG